MSDMPDPTSAAPTQLATTTATSSPQLTPDLATMLDSFNKKNLLTSKTATTGASRQNLLKTNSSALSSSSLSTTSSSQQVR